MQRTFRLALVLSLAAAMNGRPLGGAAQAQNAADTDGVRLLLQQIERAAQNGRPSDFLDLLSESADREAAIGFTMSEFASGATRVVVRERDRDALTGTLPGNGYRLSVEMFSEFGVSGIVPSYGSLTRRPLPSTGSLGTVPPLPRYNEAL